MTRIIAYMLALAIMVAGVSALTIESPSQGETITDSIDVVLNADGNETGLFYEITMNESLIATGDCDNCSQLNETVNLTSGNYTIWAQTNLGNLTINNSLWFLVELSDLEDNVTNETDTNETETTVTLELDLIHPENVTYNGLVPVEFSTNINATLSWALGNDTPTMACENCTEFFADLNLTNGTYLFTAYAVAGNQSDEKDVSFTVALAAMNETNQTDNETDDGNETDEDGGNETGEPRFTTGFQKLPKEFASGLVSDAELLNILETYKLNPGVINRLGKTGMLNDAHIDAIIENQKTPPGIFRKLMGFFGIHVKTAKEKLVDEYNLTNTQLANLAQQEDVTENTVEEVTQILRKRPITPPGQARKAQAEIETEDNVPPGQARKNGTENTFVAGSQERIPPGQAKKQDAQANKESKNGSNGRANAPGQNR